MSRLTGAAYLVCILTLLPVSACRREESGIKDSTTLRIAIREPGSLDPAFLQGNNDFQVASNVHRSLFAWDGQRSEVRHDLCLSHEHSEDLKRWTFSLDPDASFSDGTPVTAHDIVYSWKRIVDPATASPGADALAPIQGASDCLRGAPCMLGVKALTPHKLEVILTAPQPFLPELLASPRFAPVPGGKGLEPGDLADNRTGPTSGPYVVSKWEPRQSLTLVKNAHFRGHDKLPFENVVLRFTQSEETALVWFKSNEVDLATGLVPFARIGELKSQLGNQLVMLPMRSVFYFMFNLSSAPTDSLKLRSVLASAIERQRLVEFVLRAGQSPAYAFVPDSYSGTAGFGPLPCPLLHSGAQDSAPALSDQEIEAAAGAVLAFNSGETLKAIAEFVQQTVKNSTGVYLELQPVEWKSYLAMVRKGDFQIARYSLTGGPDPIDFFHNFTTGHPNNIAGYTDSQYDNLVSMARTTADRSQRFSLLHEAHSLLCRDLPAAPVYYSTQLHLVKPRFATGFRPNPEGIFMWADLL